MHKKIKQDTPFTLPFALHLGVYYRKRQVEQENIGKCVQTTKQRTILGYLRVAYLEVIGHLNTSITRKQLAKS